MTYLAAVFINGYDTGMRESNKEWAEWYWAHRALIRSRDGPNMKIKLVPIRVSLPRTA